MRLRPRKITSAFWKPCHSQAPHTPNPQSTRALGLPTSFLPSTATRFDPTKYISHHIHPVHLIPSHHLRFTNTLSALWTLSPSLPPLPTTQHPTHLITTAHPNYFFITHPCFSFPPFPLAPPSPPSPLAPPPSPPILPSPFSLLASPIRASIKNLSHHITAQHSTSLIMHAYIHLPRKNP